MSWTGRIALAGVVLVFFFALGLDPLLEPLLYTLTPLQRQYLPAYIASSWHRNDPAEQTEIHWVLKIQPRPPEPKGKHERGAKEKSDALPRVEETFAGERDVVLRPLPERIWAGGALPFLLSDEAMREGWTGLEWSYRQQVKSAELYTVLHDSFFDGRPWIGFFLQPAIALLSLCLLILIGQVGVQAWQDRRMWGRPIYRHELLWRWMFEPPAKVIQAPRQWLKAPERDAPLTLAAPVSASPNGLQVTVVKSETAQKPTSPKQTPAAPSIPQPPPAVPEKREQAYLWDETAGID